MTVTAKGQSKLLSVLAAGVALGMMPVVQAYQAGDMIVRVGAVSVQPDDSSSALGLNGTRLAGTGVSVSSDTQLGITGTYMVTDHLGLSLLAATPFQHDIKANLGGASVKAGDTKHLPPTLTLQYYPMSSGSAFQPYIGGGLNYTAFFSESVSSQLEGALGAGNGKLELDDSWGLAFNAGFDYKLTENWSVGAAVWYIDIDTTARLKFDSGVRVKADVDIDPWVYMLSLGYKF